MSSETLDITVEEVNLFTYLGSVMIGERWQLLFSNAWGRLLPDVQKCMGGTTSKSKCLFLDRQGNCFDSWNATVLYIGYKNVTFLSRGSTWQVWMHHPYEFCSAWGSGPVTAYMHILRLVRKLIYKVGVELKQKIIYQCEDMLQN